MKVVYPEKTLALLAKYDDLLNRVIEEYRLSYPEPPDKERAMLGERRYAEKYHAALSQRRRALLEDPIYQACINAKAEIISLSTCTYQFDADEFPLQR